MTRDLQYGAVRFHTLVLFVLAIFVLTACNETSTPNSPDNNGSPPKSTPTSNSSAPIFPCTLVTTAQVSAATDVTMLGGSFYNGGLDVGSLETSCSWNAADKTNFTTAELTVNPSSALFNTAIATGLSAGGSIERVPNLGQGAYYVGLGEGRVLEVRTSHGVIIVSVVLHRNSATPIQEGQQDQGELTLVQHALATYGP
jgi:hypothetical protein